MSENITHTAVCDDCLRILQVLPEICPAFKEAAAAHKDIARLGALTRAGDCCSPVLLEDFRDRRDKRTLDRQMKKKLAFVLGWLTHRAADRQMKPLFRRLCAGENQKPKECSIYHDAFILRTVYAGTRDNLYPEEIFAKQPEGLAEIKILFQSLLQASLIELHTFKPDVENASGWLDRLLALRQRFYVNLDRYAAAIREPEPEKTQRFITGPNFYDAADPVIALARKIQHGGTAGAEEAAAAFSADNGSHYARALKLGCGYLRAANKYFTGKTGAAQLKEHLDIGRPGADGKPV